MKTPPIVTLAVSLALPRGEDSHQETITLNVRPPDQVKATTPCKAAKVEMDMAACIEVDCTCLGSGQEALALGLGLELVEDTDDIFLDTKVKKEMVDRLEVDTSTSKVAKDPPQHQLRGGGTLAAGRSGTGRGAPGDGSVPLSRITTTKDMDQGIPKEGSATLPGTNNTTKDKDQGAPREGSAPLSRTTTTKDMGQGTLGEGPVPLSTRRRRSGAGRGPQDTWGIPARGEATRPSLMKDKSFAGPNPGALGTAREGRREANQARQGDLHSPHKGRLTMASGPKAEVPKMSPTDRKLYPIFSCCRKTSPRQ